MAAIALKPFNPLVVNKASPDQSSLLRHFSCPPRLFSPLSAVVCKTPLVHASILWTPYWLCLSNNKFITILVTPGKLIITLHMPIEVWARHSVKASLIDPF